MKENISILGISGSQRKFGRTVKMMNEVLSGAKKAGAITKSINLLDFKMKPYHGDFYKKPDAEVLRLIKEMQKFDGYVFASPVNWFGPSSLMKILLDNLTYLEIEGYKLEGKTFGVVTHAWIDGGYQAADYISSILNHMGLVSPPYKNVARTKFIKKNEETEFMWTDTKLLGKNIVLLTKMIKNAKPDWGY